MIKRIFWLSPAIIAGAIGLIHLLHGIAEAGTYKLEYPAGYGCKCTPNWLDYGYFRTQWRQWPGEDRLDQKHPKVIGAGPLPPVKGYEELPLPRTKLKDLQPPSGTEKPSPSPNEQPGGPAVPGAESLPGLQPEPGGLNPSPGLPPDLNIPGLQEKSKQPLELPKETPAPLEEKEQPPIEPPKDLKSDANPAVGGLKFKPESLRKDASYQPSLNRHAETGVMKSSLPIRLPDTAPAKLAVENAQVLVATKLPDTAPANLAANSQAMGQTHPQANWNSALQPGMYAETSRSGTIYPSTDIARQANFQAPVESSGSGRLSNEVVEQTFQQPQPKQWKPAPALPADSRQIAMPPIALKGYCPVELCRSGRWVQGDPRWTVIHQGCTYRLSGNDQRMQFLANPEQFAPANGGNDLVVSVNQRRTVPGDLSYCAAFKGRIYMFSSSATQVEFQKNPEQFIGKQNHNVISPMQDTSSLGVRGYQTLGRSYNQQREGF